MPDGLELPPRNVVPTGTMISLLLVLGAPLLQAPLPDSLRLPEALTFARTHRGAVLGARASVAEARAAARQLHALPNPTGGYTWNQSPPTHTAVLQQPFDWLLRRPAEAALGQAGISRARADSARSLLDLEMEVRQAWYAALAVSRGRAVAEAQLGTADSIVRVAARRFEAGDIARAELERLRLEQALALQAASRARAAEGTARAALRRVLGWPDSLSWPALSGSLLDGLEAAPGMPMRAEALPEVESALADSAAGTAALRAARAARVPLPSLEVGRQWGDPAATGGLWLVGVSLPLPLFDRGGSARDAAAARAAGASAALHEARLEADRRLATAGIELTEAATRARVARDSLLPGAALLRTRAARAWELGETGLLPLLDALRAEREIVAGALQDLLAFQEARAAWMALGGVTE